jgi:proline iminopeptidase
VRELYPEIEPYHTGRLQVSGLHSLYFEECGRRDGAAAVFLHGGPGGGIVPDSRRYFDPDFYRIVLFDQRGAGKSTPYASIEENTTWDLVEDLERLRRHLRVERWLVFGGSWGSTLALCYAVAHPERVVGLVLRGVYLGRESENRWLFQEGASWYFPEIWQKYLDPIPPDERGDLIAAYRRRLVDPDPAVHLPAAQAWSNWESAIVRLIPKPPEEEKEDPLSQLAIARLENHYIVNGMFYPGGDNYVLDHIPAIRHLPCRIVHGRYDLVCPPRSAWDLKQVYPKAELIFTPDAGHAGREPGNVHSLVQATDDFRILFEV